MVKCLRKHEKSLLGLHLCSTIVVSMHIGNPRQIADYAYIGKCSFDMYIKLRRGLRSVYILLNAPATCASVTRDSLLGMHTLSNDLATCILVTRRSFI